MEKQGAVEDSVLVPSKTEATLPWAGSWKHQEVKILSGVMFLQFDEKAKRLLLKTIPGYSIDNLTFICCGARSDIDDLSLWFVLI